MLARWCLRWAYRPPSHPHVDELITPQTVYPPIRPLGTSGLGQSANRYSGPSRNSANARVLLLLIEGAVIAKITAIAHPGRCPLPWGGDGPNIPGSIRWT